MMAIINKKKYNTETAILIHKWSNGHFSNDFGFCSEALYMTKQGAYFLAGDGGAMSKYATHRGNSSGWGERITPMTEDEALEWLESHNGEEVIITHFKDKITEA